MAGRFINADEAGIVLHEQNIFAYCKNSPPLSSDHAGFAQHYFKAMPQQYVTVCIKRPNLRNNAAFAVTSSGSFTAGHVFLKLHPNPNSSLSEKYRKNCAYGFQPKTQQTMRVALSLKYFDGAIKRNDKNPFDICISFPVLNRQYKVIYDYCTQKKAPRYHISLFNCATFAIEALNKAKVKHKFKKKAWYLGIYRLFLSGFRNALYYGYTPAQMGYDLATGNYR